MQLEFLRHDLVVHQHGVVSPYFLLSLRTDAALLHTGFSCLDLLDFACHNLFRFGFRARFWNFRRPGLGNFAGRYSDDFGVAWIIVERPSLILATSSLKRSITITLSYWTSLRLDTLRSIGGYSRICSLECSLGRLSNCVWGARTFDSFSRTVSIFSLSICIIIIIAFLNLILTWLTTHFYYQIPFVFEVTELSLAILVIFC